MSGRAGRRGKDHRGICIIMIDEQVHLWSALCLSPLSYIIVLYALDVLLWRYKFIEELVNCQDDWS